MNNNYNLNTVAKQDFEVVEQVDGRVKALEPTNVLVRKNDGGGGWRSLLSEKQFFLKNFLNRGP